SPEESQEVTALRHSASTWPEDLPRTVHLPKSEQIDTGDSDEQITEKLRRQGARIGRGTIAPAVFWPALIVIVLVAVLSIAFPESAATAMEGSQNWIVANLGWFYMLAIGIFVAFAIVVALSSWGSIRLGRDDDEPEFGLLSWFAMLFSAGMGVGLVFYGVAEPLGYTTSSPKPGWTGEGVELSGVAMAQTFLHWGLHPWAAYAVIGLALAYAIHRRGRPVSIRWALEPIFGERVKGWIGDVIDILAIFGTVFGIATSLGLGAQQIGAGMEVIGVVDEASTNFLVVLIIVITFIATFSVISGVGVGIKWLSQRGRVRQFVAGGLLVPTLVGMIWFSIWGGNGLFRQWFGTGDLGDITAEESMFRIFEQFPATQLLSVLGIILVAVFFVTSSDSGSLVVDMLASGGPPHPPIWPRVLWALLEGVVAAARVLWGGLPALRAGVLMTGLPCSIILPRMCVALVTARSLDRAELREYDRLRRLHHATEPITGEISGNHPSTEEVTTLVDDR